MDNTTDFAGKVAIVTGAGEGIGLEIARQLAVCGAQVLLNDINPDKAARAAEAVAAEAASGGGCTPAPGNAGDVTFVRGLVDEAVKRFGRIDIAVANAGITMWNHFLDFEPDAFNMVMAVNLRGSFFLAQAAARAMKARGHGGRILFVTSTAGHQAIEYLSAYGMTKAGLEMLARQLVVELAPLGITVNSVAPGSTVTPRNLEDDPNYEQSWGQLYPTGRVNTVADIAAAARFLLSPGAAQITGQTIIIDGGWTKIGPVPQLDFVEA